MSKKEPASHIGDHWTRFNFLSIETYPQKTEPHACETHCHTSWLPVAELQILQAYSQEKKNLSSRSTPRIMQHSFCREMYPCNDMSVFWLHAKYDSSSHGVLAANNISRPHGKNRGLDTGLRKKKASYNTDTLAKYFWDTLQSANKDVHDKHY